MICPTCGTWGVYDRHRPGLVGEHYPEGTYCPGRGLPLVPECRRYPCSLCRHEACGWCPECAPEVPDW